MRRSPLPHGKGLHRSTPLQHSAGRAKRSKRTGNHSGEKRARELVTARSGGVCEVQIPGVCIGRASNFHHRQNRGWDKVGKWTASNGLAVCGSGSTHCHGLLTNPPPGRKAEYETNGWIVSKYSDPSTVSVVVWPVGRVYLHDDGTYTQFHPDDLPLEQNPGQEAAA